MFLARSSFGEGRRDLIGGRQEALWIGASSLTYKKKRRVPVNRDGSLRSQKKKKIIGKG
jgi:hypothetical protein